MSISTAPTPTPDIETLIAEEIEAQREQGFGDYFEEVDIKGEYYECVGHSLFALGEILEVLDDDIAPHELDELVEKGEILKVYVPFPSSKAMFHNHDIFYYRKIE